MTMHFTPIALLLDFKKEGTDDEYSIELVSGSGQSNIDKLTK